MNNPSFLESPSSGITSAVQLIDSTTDITFSPKNTSSCSPDILFPIPNKEEWEK